jgi:hypothetical protein
VKDRADCCEVCGLQSPHLQTVILPVRIRGEVVQLGLRLCLRHALAHERYVMREVIAQLAGPLCIVSDETGEAHIFRPGDVS